MRQLEAEIKAWGAERNHQEISTVFIGGGTPSSLETEQIRRLMETVKSAFSVLPEAEITMEANPGTVDPDKLKG